MTGDRSQSSQGSGTPTQACLHCRKGKRKCDKLLPKCSLCRRLCRECTYAHLQNTEDLTPLARSAVLAGYSPASIRDKISKQAAELLGGEVGARRCVDEYFRTIHIWFPVLNESDYLEQLPQRWQDPRAEYSVLFMCMLLLVSNPAESSVSSDLLSLYTLIKSSISSLEGLGTSSIDILQCRVLVNMFELCHGLLAAANVSIAANIILADYLGVQNASNRVDMPIPSSLAAAGQATRIWRALVIMDRFLCLDGRRVTPLSKTLGTTLPASTLDQDIGLCRITGRTCGSKERSLGGLTEASHLIGQVLTHAYDPTTAYDFNSAEAIQIHKTITSFKSFLAEEESTTDIYHGSAISLCNCALLSVFERGRHLKNHKSATCLTYSKAFLRGLVDEVTRMCKQLQADASSDKFQHASPFVLCSLHLMITILSSSVDLIDETSRLKAMEHFRETLRVTSRRWQVGRHYLEILADF